jgi:hypothetical protein
VHAAAVSIFDDYVNIIIQAGLFRPHGVEAWAVAKLQYYPCRQGKLDAKYLG